MGAGSGLSASLARIGAREEMTVALAAQNIDKLAILARETDAKLHQCDVSKAKEVEQMFTDLDGAIGTPDLVVYKPPARVRGPIQDLYPEDTKKALDITCYGAFLVAQKAAKRMRIKGNGSIFLPVHPPVSKASQIRRSLPWVNLVCVVLHRLSRASCIHKIFILGIS